MADVLHGMYEIGESEYAQDELFQAMVPRMRAFIFPSVPRLSFETQAFNRAVLYQIAHETKIAELLNGQSLPQGVQSFSIGDFSMSFQSDSFNQRLTKNTICPTAYGILLEAGLMYKGVEGRLGCCHGVD